MASSPWPTCIVLPMVFPRGRLVKRKIRYSCPQITTLGGRDFVVDRVQDVKSCLGHMHHAVCRKDDEVGIVADAWG